MAEQWQYDIHERESAAMTTAELIERESALATRHGEIRDQWPDAAGLIDDPEWAMIKRELRLRGEWPRKGE